MLPLPPVSETARRRAVKLPGPQKCGEGKLPTFLVLNGFLWTEPPAHAMPSTMLPLSRRCVFMFRMKNNPITEVRPLNSVRRLLPASWAKNRPAFSPDREAGPKLAKTGDSSSEAMLPVAYECIGYLEHVSDSAHSGREPHVSIRGR